ncbi:MAG: glycosyltransferase family 4 protein [Dehalococcoidales bacterium]|jgi:glycosyltransferase involved in cell wall biosynthesis
MKRILIIRHKNYPTAVPTRRNAETLAANGYAVDIVCLRDKGEQRRENVRGVNVYRLPVMHKRQGFRRYIFEYCAFFFLAFWQVTWLSLIKKYRVIQIDNMPDFLVFTALFSKLRGTKVILQILDHTPEVFIDGFKASPKHPAVRVMRLLEKASIWFANHVLVTQSTSKDMLVSRGVPEAKISVVLNVPDENVFKSVPPSSNGNGHFRLMTHARIVDRYGLDTLINTVPLLKGEIPNLEVKIVGDGEGLPRLKELTDKLGVNDYVKFTGWVNADEIPGHIAQADVCLVVIPAGANPAMPNKLFEYSALGKPSVVTSIPSIKPYYDDNAVAYYNAGDTADLARCIIELYKDPDRRAAMAASSSAVYQKYRWGNMKHEYLNAIERLINRGAVR